MSEQREGARGGGHEQVRERPKVVRREIHDTYYSENYGARGARRTARGFSLFGPMN